MGDRCCKVVAVGPCMRACVPPPVPDLNRARRTALHRDAMTNPYRRIFLLNKKSHPGVISHTQPHPGHEGVHECTTPLTTYDYMTVAAPAYGLGEGSLIYVSTAQYVAVT